MPNREFEQAELSLRQAMQQMPDIAELSRNLIVNETAEGLNIQLVDQEGQAMFQPGTAVPLPRTRALLQQVARIVDRLPNRIAITGHTDAVNFQGPNGITNWELSAARANAARAILAAQGIESDRIFEVSGKAGTDPLLPNDPHASSNRQDQHPSDAGSARRSARLPALMPAWRPASKPHLGRGAQLELTFRLEFHWHGRLLPVIIPGSAHAGGAALRAEAGH